MLEALSAYENKRVVAYKNRTEESQPLVSVIIITYNHKLYIKQCLDSILMQQTQFDFEIVLGDDESTDGTRDICIEYAERYPEKIRLFLHHRENNITVHGNPTGRFNYLYNFNQSRGKYIAVCEGDDYWTDPFKLQKQVDFLESHPNYTFCWTRFKTYNQDSGAMVLDFNQKYFNDQQPETFIDFDFERSLKGWHIGNLTLMYRKALFNVNQHEKFKYFKDIHLVALLLKKGNGACLNFVGAVYRIHNAGVHSSVTAYKGYKIGYKTHREIYLDNPKNKFLKKKYLLSFKNYINANIQEGRLFKAFMMSIKLFLLNW